MDADTNPFPAAFLVGAPKCGTTALAVLLSQHSGVHFSHNKEPCYFCRDLTGNANRPRSIQGYIEREFGVAPPDGRVRIEGSVTSLSSRLAIPRILQERPDAKLVAMIRNPTEMACSLHAQMVYSGLQPVLDLDQAWRDRKLIAARESRWNPRCAWLNYEHVCSLGDQLERMLAQLPASQTLVLSQHHLEHQSTIDQLLDFLGLTAAPELELTRINIRKGRPRWGVFSRGVTRLSQSTPIGVARQLLRTCTPLGGFGGLSERVRNACVQETPLEPPSEATIAEMNLAFEPQCKKLDKLLPGWKTPRSP